MKFISIFRQEKHPSIFHLILILILMDPFGKDHLKGKNV